MKDEVRCDICRKTLGARGSVKIKARGARFWRDDLDQIDLCDDCWSTTVKHVRKSQENPDDR